MEEKMRYSYDYFIDGAVFIDTENDRDMDMDTVCSLLNKQDKRIKELEETNKILSNELTKNSILKQDHIETCCGIPIFEIPKMKEENEELKHQLLTFGHRISDQNDEIVELKQQLAEKTLTIEQINKAFIENRSLWKGKYEQAHQDKIDFAIEQLEKVKKFFLEEHRDEEMNTDYIITKDAGEIADYLLDQIKELKGEK